MTELSARWVRSERAREGSARRRRWTTALGDRVAAAIAAPTASQRVELAVAVCVAALRLGVVVQMLPAVGTGVALSPRPTLYAVVWGAAAAAAVIISGASLARRGPLGPRAVLADVALAVIFLLVAGLTVPTDHLMGSWVGWAPGYALSVAMTVGVLISRRVWLVAVLMIMVGYVVYVHPLFAGPERPTVIGNLLGYLVLATTLRVIIGFVRRISGEADAARAEVARLARREEEHRAQLAFHDATTVMQLLSDPSLPAELRAQLQTQAVAEVRRMRSYLRGEVVASATAPGDLAGAVAAAGEGFGDLGLQPTLDLIIGVRLEEAAAQAVVAALRTVLHNVRRHASATRVVLHGDVDGDRWTVTVRDDGRGFDPVRTPLGVGLRCQVIEELARHRIGVLLTSRPGRGTTVELSGRIAC